MIRDLDLPGHGLRSSSVRCPISCPCPTAGFSRSGRAGPGRGRKILRARRRSPRGLRGATRTHGGPFARAGARTPPNVATGRGLAPVRRASRRGARGQPPAPARDRRPARPPRDFCPLGGRRVGPWFESDPIKAILGFDGIVGTYASPYAAGTGYVLLHHCFGEANGRKGAWGHAIGGMGAITEAMARACKARGVDIRAESGAAEIVVAPAAPRPWSPKRASGSRLARRLEPASEADLRAARRSGGAARRLPRAHGVLAERLGRVPDERRAFRAAELHVPAGQRARRAPRRRDRDRPEPRLYGARLSSRRASRGSAAPIVELLIPSVLDDSLAPPGRHVASLFCQHVAPELPAGGPGMRRARRSPTS